MKCMAELGTWETPTSCGRIKLSGFGGKLNQFVK